MLTLIPYVDEERLAKLNSSAPLESESFLLLYDLKSIYECVLYMIAEELTHGNYFTVGVNCGSTIV